MKHQLELELPESKLTLKPFSQESTTIMDFSTKHATWINDH